MSKSILQASKMNIRNSADDVFVPRRQRSKYTELEERKMWWFFARELRAGNRDAVKRRMSLWKIYELQENTNKKMFGLESHFRKYMIKKIHRAAMTKEDMFICLRFFKIRLNRGQQEWLEQRYGCDIDCDVDGTFRRAHFQIGTQNNTFPTAEEEATITNNIEEDGQDGGSSQDNNDADAPKVPAANGIQQKRGFNGSGETSIHEENDNSNSDSSDDIIIIYEKRKNTNHQGGSCQHISNGKIETEIGREEEEQNEVAGGNGANKVMQIRPQEEMQTDALEEEFSEQSQMDHAADETRIMEEKRQSLSVSSNKTKSGMTKRKQALATARKAFVDGTLAVFDGRMSTRTFLDPFLYIQSGKYEGFARGINWLANDEGDQEPAYD